jgi:hypothetical protein
MVARLMFQPRGHVVRDLSVEEKHFCSLFLRCVRNQRLQCNRPIAAKNRHIFENGSQVLILLANAAATAYATLLGAKNRLVSKKASAEKNETDYRRFGGLSGGRSRLRALRERVLAFPMRSSGLLACFEEFH